MREGGDMFFLYLKLDHIHWSLFFSINHSFQLFISSLQKYLIKSDSSKIFWFCKRPLGASHSFFPSSFEFLLRCTIIRIKTLRVFEFIFLILKYYETKLYISFILRSWCGTKWLSRVHKQFLKFNELYQSMMVHTPISGTYKIYDKSIWHE